MSWNPTVSVITPSYNQGEFIQETIHSVLEQDYPNVEFIIVDGGSSDDSLEIIKKYEDHLVWISEPDNGQSDAINKGWRRSSGEIWAWLNSDDLYLPHAIRLAVEAFDKNPEVGLVYGDAMRVDRQGNPIGMQQAGPGGLRRLLWSGQHIPQPAAFIRADIVRKVGYLDTSLRNKFDYDFFIKVTSQADTYYIPEVLAKVRLYSEIKSLTNIDQNWSEKIAVLRRYRRSWYLSSVGLHYLISRIWKLLPESVQRQLRLFRGLPRDRAIMDVLPK